MHLCKKYFKEKISVAIFLIVGSVRSKPLVFDPKDLFLNKPNKGSSPKEFLVGGL